MLATNLGDLFSRILARIYSHKSWRFIFSDFSQNIFPQLQAITKIQQNKTTNLVVLHHLFNHPQDLWILWARKVDTGSVMWRCLRRLRSEASYEIPPVQLSMSSEQYSTTLYYTILYSCYEILNYQYSTILYDTIYTYVMKYHHCSFQCSRLTTY